MATLKVLTRTFVFLAALFGLAMIITSPAAAQEKPPPDDSTVEPLPADPDTPKDADTAMIQETKVEESKDELLPADPDAPKDADTAMIQETKVEESKDEPPEDAIGKPEPPPNKFNARISGRVVSALDEGVGGLKADLFSSSGPHQRTDFVRTMKTNDNGWYSFAVEPGCYIVVLIASDGQPTFDSGKYSQRNHICVEKDQRKNASTAKLVKGDDPAPPSTNDPANSDSVEINQSGGTSSIVINGKVTGDIAVTIGDTTNTATVDEGSELDGSDEPVGFVQPDSTIDPLEAFGDPEGPPPPPGTPGLINIGFQPDTGERACSRGVTEISNGIAFPFRNVPQKFWDLLSIDDPGDGAVEAFRFRLEASSCWNPLSGVVDDVEIIDASAISVGAFGGLFDARELSRRMTYNRGTADCEAGDKGCSPRYGVEVTFGVWVCVSGGVGTSQGFSLVGEFTVDFSVELPWCTKVGSVLIEQIHSSSGIWEVPRTSSSMNVLENSHNNFNFGPVASFAFIPGPVGPVSA